MKDERVMILNMLESGKITADEAERLLNALKRPGFGKSEFSENVEERFNKCIDVLNQFTKEMSAKWDDATKDIEPKIKKSAQIIVDKTTSTVDEIAKTFKGEERCDHTDCDSSDDENREN